MFFFLAYFTLYNRLQFLELAPPASAQPSTECVTSGQTDSGLSRIYQSPCAIVKQKRASRTIATIAKPHCNTPPKNPKLVNLKFDDQSRRIDRHPHNTVWLFLFLILIAQMTFFLD